MIPKLVFHTCTELLEGPVFDHQNNLLYFVSILDRLAYCYNPETKEILSLKFNSPTSCIYIIGFKKVLIASKEGFYSVDFNTLTATFKFQIEIEDDMRFNDGIQDSSGRIIIGTMGYPKIINNKGKVFSYYKGKYSTIITETTISNGLAFTSDERVLYFIDTPTRKVAKYNYNTENGTVEFDSYAITFAGDSSPDGMCIDEKGMLWIAEWGGGCVSKWDPNSGIQLDLIDLPCSNITSCCFDNLGNLYVTTAKSESETDNFGGGLFYIELDKLRTNE
ncbi:SMP-30/gluconolactonase/LRE family protein [Muricauda sp. 2012CJ35-5]|uniref:SMP-30/gluconolactonase/LRE family protein n=1 Tax=Flagellimonas spongiicola TaxID=2942208 RepID=A0ABT0PVX8_9FLAO|nr:SMP-30/gluconolactonase/LRE family protein [Allomuricauda spongiicola]MCL6275534.1 SMP-30/gluconolactonase/LRE family protein [Allomuricauda spongiicola]